MNNGLLDELLLSNERRPLTVTELSAELKGLVERSFAGVWVEGEVVGFTAHSSGHWYFNLNDGVSQLKCVCWKGTNFRIRFRPQNGLSVRVRGRISIYQARTELQLVVESLEPSGEGALAAAFEQIRMKLDKEGLFSPELKRELPLLPRRVGVVTTRSGAAIHDILNVMSRRSRSVSILLASAAVQGEGAADSIRQAIIDLNQYNAALDASEKIDVLIVGRGGGSPEDLWAFNDEHLARAIRASAIPVISAVGHEIDWSISDLIADVRAATPSAAAEMVAAREVDILRELQYDEQRLANVSARRVYDAGNLAEGLTTSMRSAITANMHIAKMRFADIAGRFSPLTLQTKAAAVGHDLEILDQRRGAAMQSLIRSGTDALNVHIAKLDALSPLGVLTRGYSITRNEDGRIIRRAADVAAGDKLNIRVENGTLNAEVISVEK